MLHNPNAPKMPGGLLVGQSHDEGGIKIKTPEGLIEAEGGETILNKRSMALGEQFVCTGTPKEMASKINELEGGVTFAPGGSCKPIGQMAKDGIELTGGEIDTSTIDAIKTWDDHGWHYVHPKDVITLTQTHEIYAHDLDDDSEFMISDRNPDELQKLIDANQFAFFSEYSIDGYAHPVIFTEEFAGGGSVGKDGRPRGVTKRMKEAVSHLYDVEQRLLDGEIIIDDKELTPEETKKYIFSNMDMIVDQGGRGNNPFDTIDFIEKYKDAKRGEDSYFHLRDVEQRLLDGEIEIDGKVLTPEEVKDFLFGHGFRIVSLGAQGYNPFDTIEILERQVVKFHAGGNLKDGIKIQNEFWSNAELSQVKYDMEKYFNQKFEDIDRKMLYNMGTIRFGSSKNNDRFYNAILAVQPIDAGLLRAANGKSLKSTAATNLSGESETYEIKYFDTKKQRVIDKIFTGENSFDAAIKWAKKNLANYNTDQIRRVYANGGGVEKGYDVNFIQDNPSNLTGKPSYEFTYSDKEGRSASGIAKFNSKINEFDIDVEVINGEPIVEQSTKTHQSIHERVWVAFGPFSTGHYEMTKMAWGGIFKSLSSKELASMDEKEVAQKVKEFSLNVDAVRQDYRSGAITGSEYSDQKRNLIDQYRTYISKANHYGISVSPSDLMVTSSLKNDTNFAPFHKRVAKDGAEIDRAKAMAQEMISSERAILRFEAKEFEKLFKIVSFQDRNYFPWYGKVVDIERYIKENKDIIPDFNSADNWETSLFKFGLQATEHNPSLDISQAAHGTVVRSSDAAVRPSPSISATIYPEGYEMEGNDGNTWKISVASNGVHRWIKKHEDGGGIGSGANNVFKRGDVVYNSEKNTIGIVRDVFNDGGGDLRTDADGVVSISELQLYDKTNPIHRSADIAPSTKTELGNKYAEDGAVVSDCGCPHIAERGTLITNYEPTVNKVAESITFVNFAETTEAIHKLVDNGVNRDHINRTGKNLTTLKFINYHTFKEAQELLVKKKAEDGLSIGELVDINTYSNNSTQLGPYGDLTEAKTIADGYNNSLNPQYQAIVTKAPFGKFRVLINKILPSKNERRIYKAGGGLKNHKTTTEELSNTLELILEEDFVKEIFAGEESFSFDTASQPDGRGEMLGTALLYIKNPKPEYLLKLDTDYHGLIVPFDAWAKANDVYMIELAKTDEKNPEFIVMISDYVTREFKDGGDLNDVEIQKGQTYYSDSSKQNFIVTDIDDKFVTVQSDIIPGLAGLDNTAVLDFKRYVREGVFILKNTPKPVALKDPQIARTILDQLGGSSKLTAMTGAYNFIDLGNGLSFRIKNPSANYIKIVLTSMDLYDVEIGRVRGNNYTVVKQANGVYFDKLKPIIEKATGMYLSLFKNGGGVGGVGIYTDKDGVRYWADKSVDDKWTVFSESPGTIKFPHVWSKRDEFKDSGFATKKEAISIAKGLAGVIVEEDPEAFFFQQTEMRNGGSIKDSEEFQSKFNTWRTGPAYNDTITELNEKNIDYVSWNDVDIYLWHIKNSK